MASLDVDLSVCFNFEFFSYARYLQRYIGRQCVLYGKRASVRIESYLSDPFPPFSFHHFPGLPLQDSLVLQKFHRINYTLIGCLSEWLTVLSISDSPHCFHSIH